MAQCPERKRRTKARLHTTDKTTFEVLRLLYVSFALMRTQANKYFVSAGLSGAAPENYDEVLLSNTGKKKAGAAQSKPGIGIGIPIHQVLMGNSGSWYLDSLSGSGRSVVA